MIDTYERGRPWNRKQWTCFGSDVEPAVGQSVSILCAKYIATGKLLCEISLEKLAKSYSQWQNFRSGLHILNEVFYLVTWCEMRGCCIYGQRLFRQHSRRSEVVSGVLWTCSTVMWWCPSCSLCLAEQLLAGQSPGPRHSLKWYHLSLVLTWNTVIVNFCEMKSPLFVDCICQNPCEFVNIVLNFKQLMFSFMYLLGHVIETDWLSLSSLTFYFSFYYIFYYKHHILHAIS